MHEGDNEDPRDESAAGEQVTAIEAETEEMVYVGDVYALVAAAGVAAGEPKAKAGAPATERAETEDDSLWPLIR